MPAHVTVVGVTSWGLTLAQLFAHAGASVRLLARTDAEAETVRRRRTEPRRIASVRLPPAVEITHQPAAALRDVEIVVLVVPAQRMRENLRHLAADLPPGAVVVSASKGIELGSGLRMSEVLGEELPRNIGRCALGGPNLAEEIARGLPATTVVAGPPDAARAVQEALGSTRFRVYTHDDVTGVELGGALKNVIALAAGIADGLGGGDNAKASLITRGLAEITRLGIALGANPLTFAGLSGLGDVIATCASPLSRNRRVGEELGRGRTLAAILAEMHHVAEGVATTEAACALAARHHVELPIAEGMRQVLRGEISAAEGSRRLMEREPRSELSG